jgi:hypothetical protein
MSLSLKDLKRTMENAFYDKDGWFDASADRERYIRYLESCIEAWKAEVDKLEAKLSVIDEQEEIRYLIEHR